MTKFLLVYNLHAGQGVAESPLSPCYPSQTSMLSVPNLHVIRPKPACYPSQTSMLSVPNLHVIRPKPACYPSQTSMLSVPNLHVIRPKPACLSDQKRRSNLKKIQMIPRNYNTACTYFLTYHRCIDPHILQIRLFSVLNIHVSGLRTWALAQDISSLAVPPPLTHTVQIIPNPCSWLRFESPADFDS